MKKNKKEKFGNVDYVNKNCWLAKTLDYSPAERCQYCELKFRDCLFSRFLIVSFILVSIILLAFFWIEGEIPRLIIITIFVLIVVYGYFFNKSTNSIIQANFAQRKAKDALAELNKTLEKRVAEQTKELRIAYDELKKLDVSKSEFISIASHQLRTPLTAVKGYVSMIVEGSYGKIPEKAKTRLSNVFESNEKLINLVNNLLSISRIESGKIKLELEKVFIEEIVKEIISDLKINAEKKKIDLKLEESEKPIPEMLLDKDKIRQVVLNLVDNAIKYTEKGEIVVRLKIKDSKLRIIVADTGEGVDKEEIGKLFQSFSRGTVGTKTHTEGSGLGLYIARLFVEMHNGRIWAESQGKGNGSTFYVELPIKE